MLLCAAPPPALEVGSVVQSPVYANPFPLDPFVPVHLGQLALCVCAGISFAVSLWVLLPYAPRGL